MDREQALAKVAKLRALADPARGGTDGERAVARAKAEVLERRFRLGRVAPPPPQRPRRFEVPVRGKPRAWDFDMRTGQGSGNVKVHRYQDRANWKIEVKL